MLKFLCFALLATFTLGNYLGCKDYDEAYRAIDDLISHDDELIPSFVRLAFHDCVGKSCDGCINFKDHSNAGLGVNVQKLDKLFDHRFHKDWSRADFWQLASQVALVRAGLNRKCHHDHHDHKECTFFDIQFKWGRKDCHSSPHHKHDDDAGDSHGDFHEVYRVLHGNFHLDEKEIVAILGTHNLGGAHKFGGSGHDYNWQREHLVFDNQYYKNLISLPYTHEDVTEEVEPGQKVDPHAPPRLQFAYVPKDKHADPLLMLNTDVSLWKNVKANKEKGHYTGELTCALEHTKKEINIPDGEERIVDHCEDAKTNHIVYDFAHHLDHFYDNFERAWWKMTSNGYDGHHGHLEAPGKEHEHCGNCIPHGAFCVEGFEKSGKCCHGSHCVHNKCV